MAQRIRTVKPDLFKHEGLFDLEVESGLPMRTIFAGIFTLADREGRFKWRPRAMRAEAFPFDSWDMSRALDALASRGFLVRYEIQGEIYGYIPSWTLHQFVNGKEAKSALPAPPQGHPLDQSNVAFDAMLSRQDRVSDVTTTHGVKEGKGREGEEQRTPPSREAPSFQQVENTGYPDGMPVVAMVTEMFARTAQAQPYGVANLAAQAIAAIAQHENESLAKAAGLLEARIRSATRAGETINRFWFEDGKWKVREGTENEHNPRHSSPATQRVANGVSAFRAAANRAAEAELAAGADADAVSPSGPQFGGRDVLSGLSRADEPVRTDQSRAGPNENTHHAGVEVLPPTK